MCYAWARGECTRGSACKFSHEGPGAAATGFSEHGGPVDAVHPESVALPGRASMESTPSETWARAYQQRVPTRAVKAAQRQSAGRVSHSRRGSATAATNVGTGTLLVREMRSYHRHPSDLAPNFPVTLRWEAWEGP